MTRFCGALFLAGWLACAQAAELGDVVARSHIGQPLVADIELTGVSEDAAPVQVRLAHPDVFRGANIRMHPALSSLTMSVMRRDGRQFLHITSIKPVDDAHLLLFLELSDGGKRSVRAATVWLTPDPAPAPPVPPPAPVPVPAPAPVPAPVRAPAPAAPARAAIKMPVAQTPVPAALRLPAPAACPQRFTDQQIRTCAEVDYKNGVLTAQIVELEEKVRLLQLAIEGNAPAAKGAKPAAPARIAASGPPPIKPPEKDKKAPAAEATPWLLIGGAALGVLALLGGLLLFVVKRKTGKRGAAPVVTPAGPNWIARLRERLRRKKEAAAPAVEPTAE